MDIRKIAAAGALAAGAGLALAPLAAADPTEITSTVSSEIASLNSQFEFDALLAGDSADITKATTLNPFDIVTPADIATVQGTPTSLTPFDYLVYGADPKDAGLSTDPGSYNVFNGAEAKFDDAYNVALYAVENHNALDVNPADFIGNLPSGFASDTPGEAVAYFYNFALGDLYGDLGLPAADYASFASTFDITAAQATSLIDLFEPATTAASSLF